MNNREAAIGTEEYAALIGMDWATEKHDAWLWAATTGASQHRVVAHTPEALAEGRGEWQARYPGRRWKRFRRPSRRRSGRSTTRTTAVGRIRSRVSSKRSPPPNR